MTDLGMTQQLWTWREATERALYGDDGFFRRNKPRSHFRTSVHASPLFAKALLRLATTTGRSSVVDVGAGGGELLTALHGLDPSLELTGVERAKRPPQFADRIEWLDAMPQKTNALVVANEWLDNVPVDVVEVVEDGWRVVLVDPATGTERIGPPPDPDDLNWLDHWWPAGKPGDRAEVGRPRDEAWARVIGALDHGVAVAIDYWHRADARPASGSLTGFRDGRQVAPVPDGSTDITSHVALDACGEAGEQAGATATLLTTQRAALHALGVRGDRPDPQLAHTDPSAYLHALARAGEAAELTDPDGFGGFGWLVQAVGVEIPQELTGTER